MNTDELKEYAEFYTRNSGYVSEALQEKIRTTRVLIAGCGIGSPIAEYCVRLGFVHIGLADLDVVEKHNLNRQSYVYADIGTPKVEALKRRLEAINPAVSVTLYPKGLTPENVKEAVVQSDFVFDTIDFLELSAIVMLHDEAHAQKKPIISAVGTGWGAAAIYFPPTDAPYCDFRRLFSLPNEGDVKNESYVSHFKHFLECIAAELDPIVIDVMVKALTTMKDGKPCPASQVSPGSAALAGLTVTYLVKILEGEPVAVSPRLIINNLTAVIRGEGVNIEPHA